MAISPEIRTVPIQYKGRTFSIEYFIRPGSAGTIILVHGLGGAKENFWDSTKVAALAAYRLIAFDNPGTGNSTYFEDLPLNVDDLVAITGLFIDKLEVNSFVLAGASMGGLTTLNYLRRSTNKVLGYVNIEGNLLIEDCMFSGKVIQHAYESFANVLYPETIHKMRSHPSTGYRVIANNLELNTNKQAYYSYSFQTVEYSGTGELLTAFVALGIPKLFIYGDRNSHLSYLPRLEAAGIQSISIPEADHFVFYDNPAAMYWAIANFLKEIF